MIGGHRHLRVRRALDRQRFVEAHARAALQRRLDERHVRAAAEHEFRRQVGQARRALAGAERIAGLSHEIVDHAVKGQTVIDSRARVSVFDPLDVLGRHFGIQFHHDAAVDRSM